MQSIATALSRYATALVGVAILGGGLPAIAETRATTPPEDAAEIRAAFADFAARILETEESMQSLDSFGTDAEQAGGYMALLRALVKGIEGEVFQDVDYPYFRFVDFWLREGGDNPDQKYAFSPVRGGADYRIWGTLGSARRIEFQLYSGQPWAGTGRSVGYLAFEDIELNPDGSFEVHITSASREGNWLEMPSDATTIFSRHIYDEWNDATPGTLHIDRVGYEGKRRPQLSTEELAARLRKAGATFERTAKTWPAFVAQRYVASLARNTMPEPVDTYALGGAKGRWMSNGYFDLKPDEALLITTWPTKAQYQAMQLADMWFASLESANQISSLTTKQSLLSPDGAYYTVVSAADPGHANWLDTGGLPRGVVLMRYDGVQGKLPESQYPSARRVPLAEIPNLIPGFEVVSEAERERVRAARRKHLQLRSGR